MRILSGHFSAPSVGFVSTKSSQDHHDANTRVLFAFGSLLVMTLSLSIEARSPCFLRWARFPSLAELEAEPDDILLVPWRERDYYLPMNDKAAAGRGGRTNPHNPRMPVSLGSVSKALSRELLQSITEFDSTLVVRYHESRVRKSDRPRRCN